MTSVSDAAKIIGVKPVRVRQFIKEGRLKPTGRFNGAYVFDRLQVEEFAKIPREAGNPNFKKDKR